MAAPVSQGTRDREAAAAPVLSPRTIDGHAENIRAAPGFRSRVRIASLWTVNQELSR